MRKRGLEIALQRIDGIPSPKAELEQYSTPADIAADVLFIAHGRGDLEGRRVLDLGCGNGVLGIGAALMGADVICVDRDPVCVELTRENAESAGVVIDVMECDVNDVDERADVVIMNPPFGCQAKGADRPFLEVAMSCAPVVYSMHMASTLEFLERYVGELGGMIIGEKRYKFPIPNTFSFHRETGRDVEVSLILIRNDGELS